MKLNGASLPLAKTDGIIRGAGVPYDPPDGFTWYRDKDDPSLLYPAVITCTQSNLKNVEAGDDVLLTYTYGVTVFYPSHIDCMASGIRCHPTDAGCVVG